MGYRSDVVIAIHKKAKALSVIAGNWPSLFQTTEYTEEAEDYFLFILESVKWYPAYEDVQEVEKFISFLENQGSPPTGYEEFYAFARVGEEMGDWEESGDPYSYGIGTSQSITY